MEINTSKVHNFFPAEPAEYKALAFLKPDLQLHLDQVPTVLQNFQSSLYFQLAELAVLQHPSIF